MSDASTRGVLPMSSSIRLLLALLTVLGTHGWVVDNTIQAAGPQKLSHNLLFRYSEPVQALPPAFFALSIPCKLPKPVRDTSHDST